MIDVDATAAAIVEWLTQHGTSSERFWDADVGYYKPTYRAMSLLFNPDFAGVAMQEALNDRTPTLQETRAIFRAAAPFFREFADAHADELAALYDYFKAAEE